MLTFLLPSSSQLSRLQKDVPSTPSLVEAFKKGFAENALILAYLTTLSQATMAYKRKSFQMRCLTIASCHHSWLNTWSLRSIQKSPTNNATEEVLNLPFFGELRRNSLPKEGLFPMKTIKITAPDPA